MKFKNNTLYAKGRKYFYLNDLSPAEQKKLLKEDPSLERFVEYEDDKEGTENDVEIQPQPKSSKRSKRKPKSE